MGFAENKQQEFTKKIRDLPDQPNIQPHELKEYFDSSPEELRQSHNGLCDALTAKTAASALGFSRTAGVPADTVQTAVENVQQQLNAAVMGNIPSGSVTGDKLAQDVRDRLTAIESAAAAETSTRAGADRSEAETRANADVNLQNQINTLSAAKCEAYIGTYMGDDQESQFVHLGFTPKAVLVFNNSGQTCTGYNYYYYTGGLAVTGHPVMGSQEKYAIEITENGFRVFYHYVNNRDYTITNSGLHHFIAFR